MNFYYEPNRVKRAGFERSRKGSGGEDMHVGVGLKEWVPTREMKTVGKENNASCISLSPGNREGGK